MKILSVYLVGYIGIWNGLGLKEIFIDFTKAKHKICVISGPNGVGKSTLCDAITILPDGNESFIPNTNAQKQIVLEDDGVIYSVTIYHNIANKGTRETKGYITKNGIELNGSGSITQYREIISSEFDIDTGFMNLAKVSTESRGLADKKPAERKKLVASRIASLETYNGIYKNLNKRANTFKAQINTISSKLASIGKKNDLLTELHSLYSTSSSLSAAIECSKEELTSLKTKVEMYDPDGGISKENEEIIQKIRGLEKDISILTKRFTDLAGDDSNSIDDNMINDVLLSINEKLSTVNNTLNEAKIQEGIIEKQISDTSKKMSEKMEESSHLEREIDKITYENSKDEAFLDDDKTKTVKEAIKKYKRDLFEVEKLIKERDLTEASEKISVETCLNLYKVISNMAQGIMNMSEYYDTEANDFVMEIYDKDNQLDNPIDVAKEKLGRLTEDIERAEDKAKSAQILLAEIEAKLDTLNNQSIANATIPTDCKKYGNCNLAKLFINTQDEIEKLNKEKSDVVKELNKINDKISKNKSYMQELQNLLYFLVSINDMIIYLKPSADALKAFIGDLFKDKEYTIRKPIELYEAFKLVYKQKELAMMLYNNMTDKVKCITSIATMEQALERSEKLKAGLNDLKAKKEYIDKEVSELTEEQRKLNKDKTFTISGIAIQTSVIENYTARKDILEKMIERKKQLTEYQNIISENKSKFVQVTEMNERIIKLRSTIDDDTIRLNEIDKAKSSIDTKLALIDEFSAEYDQYKEKYNYINVLRKYSSPTQGSIQTLFMQMYMNKTLDLTNQILSMLFQGRYRIVDYIINEDEFRIPFVGDGLVVDDISSGSTSQKCIMGSIINLVLFSSSSSVYNIASMDEIDGGLDHNNRLMFVDVVQSLIDTLGISQLLLISHSIEASLNNIDVILLSSDPEYVSQFSNANIIYQYKEDSESGR